MKHVILAISLLVLVSCKDSTKQKTSTNTNVVEITHEHHDNDEENLHGNSWKLAIEMNNGSKWKANNKTNKGVEKMQNSIKTQPTNSLEDYYKLAEQLNDDKNYVVRNCTMNGDSHDNLHVWLMPLIKKIEALSEVKKIEEALKLKHSIEENINAYNTYFY